MVNPALIWVKFLKRGILFSTVGLPKYAMAITHFKTGIGFWGEVGLLRVCFHIISVGSVRNDWEKNVRECNSKRNSGWPACSEGYQQTLRGTICGGLAQQKVPKGPQM
jgi:hypothetical protein